MMRATSSFAFAENDASRKRTSRRSRISNQPMADHGPY
ncbi:hypothetical protein CHELA20_53528 [Hyphomicrobiales bacterium]|nr:hypothetical protein CHELA20_53528 [Hyphomicrobiales bacterium]